MRWASYVVARPDFQVDFPVLARYSGFLLTSERAELGHQVAEFERPRAEKYRPGPPPRPRTLDELLALDNEQIERCSIALMNLLCATDLPGAEDLDIPACLARLRLWASRVRYETQRHLYRFQENPQKFQNSEAFYRMMMMATVLCEDFRIRYNPALQAPSVVPRRMRQRDAHDYYRHGVLGPTRLGTCASMPVLYMAIGEILGYPLRLARAPSHCYVVWRDERTGEKLNIEATASRGFCTMTDADYIEECRKLGEPMSQRDIDAGFFLKPLSRSESLSAFLVNRGLTLYACGRVVEAIRAHSAAASLNPLDAGAARNARDFAQWIVQWQFPDPHPLAMDLDDPADPRAVLAPQDAACYCNAVGHCAENGGKDIEAWFGYFDAARLDPVNIRYRESMRRIRGRFSAQALRDGSSDCVVTRDEYAATATVGEKEADFWIPKLLQHNPLLCMGFESERAGDLIMAQVWYARAIVEGGGPESITPLHLLRHAVKRELVANAPSPAPDPRDQLPPHAKAFIFAARGFTLQRQRRFADSRNNFAIALHLHRDGTEYAELLRKADALAQSEEFHEKNGFDPPRNWRPAVLQFVKTREIGPLRMSPWIPPQ